ncbi:MAG TPA: hypothetical protein VGI72_05755 [Gaiellales bacterium]|jgi:hypothetical protein
MLDVVGAVLLIVAAVVGAALIVSAAVQARRGIGATRLAERPDTDVHAVVALIRRGCAAPLAARITEPLPGRAPAITTTTIDNTRR